jgi:hypothetical protein
MLCQGLGKARLIDVANCEINGIAPPKPDRSLFKAIYSKAYDCIQDMKWQTMAHIEFYIRENNFNRNEERGRSLLLEMKEKSKIILNEIEIQNLKVEKVLEKRIFSLMEKEAFENKKTNIAVLFQNGK